MNTYEVTCLGETIEIHAPDIYEAFSAGRHHFGSNAPVSYPKLVEGDDVERPFPRTTSPS